MAVAKCGRQDFHSENAKNTRTHVDEHPRVRARAFAFAYCAVTGNSKCGHTPLHEKALSQTCPRGIQDPATPTTAPPPVVDDAFPAAFRPQPLGPLSRHGRDRPGLRLVLFRDGDAFPIAARSHSLHALQGQRALRGGSHLVLQPLYDASYTLRPVPSWPMPETG